MSDSVSKSEGVSGSSESPRREGSARPEGRPASKRDKEQDLKIVGQTIAGKYHVLDVLGQGGFGSVFLVEMTSGIVGDRLAMKILPRELSENSVLRDQFLNEIRVAMRMVDKYIVQIRDVGLTEEDPTGADPTAGLLYYTMDYVPGLTLAELLQRSGRLSVGRTLHHALRVLRALRTAHGNGIIHRDLKPANIMVIQEEGHETTRVLDFGIATAVEGEGSAEGSPVDQAARQKRKRGFAGSPYYMPPEQFLGSELSYYSDLYSVGVILYECLSGERPHKGNTPREVFDSIKSGPPRDIAELVPEVAGFPGLREVVMRSLERNPERRFQTAKEFSEALNSIARGEFDDETPVATLRPGTAPAAVSPEKNAGERIGRAARRARLATARKSGPSATLVLAVLVILGGIAAGAFFLFRLREDEIATDTPGAAGAAASPDDVPNGAAPRIGPEVPDAPASTIASTLPQPSPVGTPPATSSNPEPVGGAAPQPSSVDRGASGSDASSEDSGARAVALARLDASIREAIASARSALAKGDLRIAEEQATTILDVRPSHPVGRLLRGTVLVRLSQFENAVAPLEAAIPELRGADLVDARWLLAEALLRRSKPDPDRATRELRAILETEPKHAAAARRLAELLRDGAKPAELRAHLIASKAAGVEDELVDSLHQELVVEAERRAKESLEKHTIAAREANQSGDWPVASIQAEAALELATSLGSGALLELALIAHEASARLGDSKAAEKTLERVLALAKEDPSLADDSSWALKRTYLEGRVALLEFLRKRKKSDALSALAKLEKVASSASKTREEALWSWAHTCLGQLHAEQTGEIQLVNLAFTPTRDVRDGELIYVQAKTYQTLAEKQQDRDLREECYKLARARLLNLLRVSGLQPDLERDGYHRLGQCYTAIGLLRADDGDLRKAVNRYQTARDKGLRTTRLFEDLGDTYSSLDEPIWAAQSYRDAYRIEPSVARCLRAVDLFLRANPRNPQAREILEEALVQFPNDPKLRKALSELPR